MDRMLVVVFDNESKAWEGKNALVQLDDEGSIGLWAYAVVTKKADGTATVKQGERPRAAWYAWRDSAGEPDRCSVWAGRGGGRRNRRDVRRRYGRPGPCRSWG